jgi:hypothetical protein
MEWDLSEVLSEVKRVYYTNIHAIERLMLLNSMAQNVAREKLQKQRSRAGYLFTMEELAAFNFFQLIRLDLIQLRHQSEESRRNGFYQVRRRLIENIESIGREESSPLKFQEAALPTAPVTGAVAV